eukprot:m.56369 g.56369  ORF g.56369 m.56369 type:complete len:703 (+) comp34591_c0_seq1:1573-3681(+)
MDAVQSVITMWDEGGQEQYLNMQIPFIAKDAVQLLVFDLTKDPNERITSTHFRHAFGEIQQPCFSSKTYGDVLLFWLSMMTISQGDFLSSLDRFFSGAISSNQVVRMGEAFKLKVASPPCMLIGTRAHSRDAKIQKYQQFFKEMFCTQLAKLANHVVENTKVAGDPKCDSLLFFPVECNNVAFEKTDGRFTEDPTFKTIRIVIMEATKRFWEERRLPKSWFLLLLLTDIVSKDLAIVSFESLFDLAKEECKITKKEEFNMALKYLDWLGVVVYKPDSKYTCLSEYVITDPSWLFELFSSFLPTMPGNLLVSHAERFDGQLYETFREDLVEVQTMGLMSHKLVQYFLDQVTRTTLSGKDLLKLLQDFDVLAVCRTRENKVEGEDDEKVHWDRLLDKERYYVPCLVQIDLVESKCFINGARRCSPCLVLKAQTILFWPEPLFFRLTTRLLNKYQPGNPIVERHRVVLRDIRNSDDSLEFKTALELIYLRQCYVVATMRYDNDENLKAIHAKCRKIRKEISEEIEECKTLGFQGFTYHNCMSKSPRTFPSKDEDLYVDLDGRLKFEGRRVYFNKDDGDDELLNNSYVAEVRYWYGSDLMQDACKSSYQVESSSTGNAKERRPSDKELNKVSKKIVSNWKPLARCLGIPKEKIAEMQKNFQEDVREQACEMLFTWRQRKGKLATVADLVKALLEEDLNEIAEEVFG